MMAFKRLGVLGAGTMGAGIAQICALAGLETWLYDVAADGLDQARKRMTASVDQAMARQKAKPDAPQTLDRNLHTVTDLATFAPVVDLVIEAVPEDLALKTRLFAELDTRCPPHTGFASNTSSLSITAMAAATTRPGQVAGMHFFNPVPQMKLVEIIAGHATAPDYLTALADLARFLGKTPVQAQDTPGFIVNRVARPFYGEALRLLGEGLADIPTIDAAMKDPGGFAMGPFELMDLIGIDINDAVTRSVYEAYFQEPRFRPHPLQRRMVAAGTLGRKTGCGFYTYPDKTPTLFPPTHAGRSTVSPDAIVSRLVAMIANEAAFAVMEGIASPQAIDTAMTLGTNYPEGPCAWADRQGAAHVYDLLDTLWQTYREERYRPCPLWQSLMASGRPLSS